MGQDFKRVYVSKKDGLCREEAQKHTDIRETLKIGEVEKLKIINCYDIWGLGDDDFDTAKLHVLSQPNLDDISDGMDTSSWDFIFRVAHRKGQFNQRSESAKQCVEIIIGSKDFDIHASKIYGLKGKLSLEQQAKIKKYFINPTELVEVHMDDVDLLDMNPVSDTDTKLIHGFTEASEHIIFKIAKELSLGMSDNDLLFTKDYFKSVEERDPTLTELRVIDGYWSDHCRHKTFLTKIGQVEFDHEPLNGPVIRAYEEFLEDYMSLSGKDVENITLMDIATLHMKNMDKSHGGVNGCSFETKVDMDGSEEDYVIVFKNETHNHPTEIHPFGGAATCLGGAIRDIIAEKAYAYQAMRVSGSGDPRKNIEETLTGKLPQKYITKGAALGFSSYGNQVGISTGQVKEYYHEGFVAKRMEIGFVIGARPADKVKAHDVRAGDLVILVGGATGRDGCSGAVGSSASHSEKTIEKCGSQVQNGNPITERKLNRLMRNMRATSIIKRANDCGAGGLSVALGELADGMEVDLDKVFVKSGDLSGTEIAISESQERMLFVIDPADFGEFSDHLDMENLEYSMIATVDDSKKIKMTWKGSLIVDMSMEFLNSNGVAENTQVRVKAPSMDHKYAMCSSRQDVSHIGSYLNDTIGGLDISSQKGLIEMFDSTIGRGSIIMPFGGRFHNTPVDGMVSKVPVGEFRTSTCSIVTHGYDPYIGSWSPFHGGVHAVIESLAKVVALGGDYSKSHLSFQEYFEKLGDDPYKWGKPFAGLLGAYHAQKRFGVAAIGGKDSMSGSFNDIHVPPTLVSFCVCMSDGDYIISPELKASGSKLLLIKCDMDICGMPDTKQLILNFSGIHKLAIQKKILSACAVTGGNVMATLCKMGFGNEIGIEISEKLDLNSIIKDSYGSIIVELPCGYGDDDLKYMEYIHIGQTTQGNGVRFKDEFVEYDSLIGKWEDSLNGVFPVKHDNVHVIKPRILEYRHGPYVKSKFQVPRPKVFMPIFPGTNCEYDTERAFHKAGGSVESVVFKNINGNHINDSIRELAMQISKSQILVIPGGFSAGDEPDGSGKFISAVLKNPRIMESINELIYKRDGLILGICNGFQALMNIGMLPNGVISQLDASSPALGYNAIGRHGSKMARVKVVSSMSPWMNRVEPGDIFEVPISHGEGRFFAGNELIRELELNGQVATQYVDYDDMPSTMEKFNPGGSKEAIESISSPDGRILGKMGHLERVNSTGYINTYTKKDMEIFESGVNYFL